MPLLRASQAIRVIKSTSSPCSTLTKTSIPAHTTISGPNAAGSQRTFTSTTIRSSGDAHEDHYDPPTGWLWGIKPGEKPEKEGWETVWFYGFFGSLAFGVVGYAFKPDTSIQTWALEEARRRLEVEGILKEPEDKP